MRAPMSAGVSGFRLNCRQRDSTVTGIFCGSVVASTKRDVLGRLLERLQHRVERRLRQHVHFVDQVDLVAAGRRRVARVVEDLAHVVDAGVGRGVEFEQVDEAPGVDVLAGRADAAGRRGHAGQAVEALGEDARDRRLAHAPRAGQQVRMVDASARQRVGERRDDVLLPGEFGERHRPPLAREYLVAHPRIIARLAASSPPGHARIAARARPASDAVRRGPPAVGGWRRRGAAAAARPAGFHAGPAAGNGWRAVIPALA